MKIIKRMKLNTFLLLLILALVVESPSIKALVPTENADTIVDDSLRDMSMVLGVGAAGAVLGLSTLSFVENPGEHLRNIAVGGALGIALGVGIVVFSQATRSSAVIGSSKPLDLPMSNEKFASITRKEFSNSSMVKNFFEKPHFVFHFDF